MKKNLNQKIYEAFGTAHHFDNKLKVYYLQGRSQGRVGQIKTGRGRGDEVKWRLSCGGKN